MVKYVGAVVTNGGGFVYPPNINYTGGCLRREPEGKWLDCKGKHLQCFFLDVDRGT